MLGSLVWLFPAHREAVLLIEALRRENALLRQSLEYQTRLVAAAPGPMSTSIQQLTEELLSEVPFPNGIVPEHLFLSPAPPVTEDADAA